MKKIVAITACPTGVAHTYMSAQKIEDTARSLGYDVHVEKQGAMGIEDKLTKEQIAAADVVIFAVDTNVRDAERFAGKAIYRCPVAAPIKDCHKVFEEAFKAKPTDDVEGKISVKKSILSGVSYMIPIVIAASVIMGIARVGAMLMGVTDIWDAAYAEVGGLIEFFHVLDGLGGTVLSLMLPVFAGYIAYSMAGKPGLASGFSGGLIAAKIGAGFLGALAAGLFAGWITKVLKDKIKVSGAASSIVPIFIIPVGSVLATALMTQFVIGIPCAWLNATLTEMLNNMSSQSAVLMAMVLGAMVGFDLGGPVNKAAVVASMGLISSGLFLPNTAVQVAIIIPTLGYGIATLVAGKEFSTPFRSAGSASLVMGLVGVSEGAIPFTLANPKILIPFNMLGCAVGAGFAVGLGAVNQIPISGIYGWLLVEKWPIYVIGIFLGAAIVAAGAILSKKHFQSDDMESII